MHAARAPSQLPPLSHSRDRSRQIQQRAGSQEGELIRLSLSRVIQIFYSQAQNALNNCVLGNTTILAATAEEPEVESIIRTLSQHSAGGE